MHSATRTGRRILFAAAAAALTRPVLGQEAWRPPRPVRLLVGFPPGGFTDILARTVAPLFQARFEQSVVVENRGGAAGVLAAEAAARAAPDGTTLLIGHPTANAIVAGLATRLSYDPRTAFTPVTLIAAQPHLLLVNAESPYRSVDDLLAAARRDPGRLTFASSGVASVQHVAGELFKAATGVDVVHVPYRGTGPAMADLAGGQVTFAIDGAGGAGALLAAGRLRALAVSSARRAAKLPDIPTLAEVGVRGVEIGSWFALMGPAGLPEPAVAALHAAVVEALAHPTMRRVMDDASAEPGGMPPAEFRAFILAEIERYRDLGTRTRISMD
jgi:tripartite-type tricarboxylate transporter receptor subunit TctC